MGFCEHKLWLDHLHGATETKEMVAGRHAHARFDSDAKAAAPAIHERDPRCFIATMAFGRDAWETERLRRFRDEALMTSALGRGLTRLYYRTSPALCRFADRNTWARTIAQRTLIMVIRVLR